MPISVKKHVVFTLRINYGCLMICGSALSRELKLEVPHLSNHWLVSQVRTTSNTNFRKKHTSVLCDKNNVLQRSLGFTN